MKKILIGTIAALLIFAAACGGNKSGSPSGSVQMPNPVVPYATLDEAKAALSFTAQAPEAEPDGYSTDRIGVIGGTVLQIDYKNGDQTITYRNAEGGGDISGDYNTYSLTESAMIAGREVTMKGEEGDVRLVTWTDGGQAFSLSFTDVVPGTVNTALLQGIISSIA